MKRIFGIICIAAPLLISSCSSAGDLEDLEQTGSEALTVQLNLNTGLPSTRSYDPNHVPKEGTAAESFINIINKDYQIYIVNGEDDGKIISKFEPSSVVRTDNGTYRLLGTFYNEPGLKKIRFMALANWKTAFTTGNYPDVPAEDDFSINDLYTNHTDYNFIYPVTALWGGRTWTPDNKSLGIPMAGLSEPLPIPEKGTSVPGQTPWIEVTSINMLRALAKITVTDKTDKDEIEIVSVKIKNYNSDGRFIPEGSVEENKNWNQEETQVKRPTLTKEPIKGIELNFKKSEDGKSFIAYVPEVDNLTPTDEDECYLEVTTRLMGLYEKTDIIYFGEYSKGKYKPNTAMDILRNHWYNFDINNVIFEAEKGLEVSVEVVDEWDYIHEMELE